MKRPPHSSLFVGSRGDVFAELGTGFPMFFVRKQDIPTVFGKPPIGIPHVLHCAGEVAMVASLIPDTRDFEAFGEAPSGIPPNTAAFRLHLNNGLRVGYVGHPKAVHLTDWYGQHGIDILVTPRNVRICAFDGIARSHESRQTVDFWDDRFAAIGPRHLPGADIAWEETVETYHRLHPD